MRKAPPPFTSKHGAVWYARETTDTLEMAAARKRRDEIRAQAPPVGNSGLLDSCANAVAKVRALSEQSVPPSVVRAAAEKVSSMIEKAIRKDPSSIPDLIDILESLADILTERQDTHFASPSVFIYLALQWDRIGEREAAKQLLEVTISVLNISFVDDDQPIGIARDLARAHCALAELLQAEHEQVARLIAVRRAWDWAQFGDAPLKLFVIKQYRTVLEAQARPREVIEAAMWLEQRLDGESE